MKTKKQILVKMRNIRKELIKEIYNKGFSDGQDDLLERLKVEVRKENLDCCVGKFSNRTIINIVEKLRSEKK